MVGKIMDGKIIFFGWQKTGRCGGQRSVTLLRKKILPSMILPALSFLHAGEAEQKALFTLLKRAMARRWPTR